MALQNLKKKKRAGGEEVQELSASKMLELIMKEAELEKAQNH